MRVVLALLLVVFALSGCLADDIWREPFTWQGIADAGENPDGAKALAAALEGLGEEAQEEGDVVVETADDLPDNAVFQNLRDFLNEQDPGRGDEVDEQVRVAAGEAASGYATLTGEAAQAYSQTAGPINGTPPVTFHVPDRTTRLRMQVDVVLAQEAPERGGNPAPLGEVEIRLMDPSGALRATYELDTSRSFADMWFEGTYGDANEVREHLGGPWVLDVDGRGEGAWSVALEAYVPELEDYKWYEFWRADKRQAVTG